MTEWAIFSDGIFLELFQMNFRYWYFFLDNIKLNINQAQNRNALEILHPLLSVPKLNSGTWRNNPKYFQNRYECKYPPGIVNLVPLWYQAGHGVS
jgi:hypothetical protein